MKTKVIMVLAACLLTGTACFAQNGQAGIAGDGSETQELNARRAEIIESRFAFMLAELQLRSERQIRLLEVAEQVPSGLSPSIQLYCVEAVLRLNGYDSPRYQGNGEDPDIAGERLAAALTKTAKIKRDIIARTEFEAAALERQLHAALRDVEKDISRTVSPVVARVTPRGVVQGIVYSTDRPGVLIDGQILHEGDAVNGVLIVKIYPDQVGFGKDNQTWMQKVGQNPQQ